MKSRFVFGSSLEPLAGVPFVAVYGEEDDHLRVVVQLATSLGKQGDEDVRTCSRPNVTWPERLDAFEELLRRVQGRRPQGAFAGLLHPDAFPTSGGDELEDDASFALQRWQLFRVLLRSFERGGWLLVRPEPRRETSHALHGYGCVADMGASPEGIDEDEERLHRALIRAELSPAAQSLVWGLVQTGRMRPRTAALLFEDAKPELADAMAFETAYDSLSGVALAALERLSVLRGPQGLNGAAGPFIVREDDLGAHALPRRAISELVDGGWLGLGKGSTGDRHFVLAEGVRRRVYERAAMVDDIAVREQHRWLAERGGDTVPEQVEAHHHAISCEDEQLALATAKYYGADLRLLARSLSEQAAGGEPEKYLRAAALYAAIVERYDRDDAYAWEYRAYNLALYHRRRGEPIPPAVEAEIRRCYAMACKLDEDNALYCGRELGFRASLGEDVTGEFRRHMYRFRRLGQWREVRFASPVLERLPSLADRLHLAAPWLAELKRDEKLRGLLE